jgi:hypothetical protein
VLGRYSLLPVSTRKTTVWANIRLTRNRPAKSRVFWASGRSRIDSTTASSHTNRRRKAAFENRRPARTTTHGRTDERSVIRQISDINGGMRRAFPPYACQLEVGRGTSGNSIEPARVYLCSALRTRWQAQRSL